MTRLALFGAAGKIGSRITALLKDDPDYALLPVEAGEAGQARLRAMNLTPVSADEAASQADVVVLAVPDVLLGKIAATVVPLLKSGALVICLDPAAPHGGELPPRSDIAYFVTHPCHPPVFNDEVGPPARADHFGGIAKQNSVCALMQGPESAYTLGEKIARKMFAPVMNAHRVTVEQMATLEPALSETVVLTCMYVVREAMDEAIKRGVPPEAARDFLLGHIGINIAILFDFLDTQFSDGAKLAVERGKQQIFQPDWRKVFEKENIYREVKAITAGLSANKA